MSEKQQREFWLFKDGTGTKDPEYLATCPDDSFRDEFIHVIEKSAYDAIRAERDELNLALRIANQMIKERDAVMEGL